MIREEKVTELERKCPYTSFSFWSDKEVDDVYNELLGTDLIYEEVLTGLFGRAKGPEVKNEETGEVITVSRQELKKLYKPLNLREYVFKEVVEAHDKVLTTGFSANAEHVIAIDIETGVTVREMIGESGTGFVEWRFPRDYGGEIFTIHNHPNNTPFSPKDLYYFNKVKQKLFMCVQCHNGTMYSLQKEFGGNFKVVESTFQEAFDKIRNEDRRAYKSFIESGERFVTEISVSLGWKFMKGR
jgi:hypothetical protein